MDAQPASKAIRTICSGSSGSPSTFFNSRGDWDSVQFWQKAHRKLHPTVAMEKLREPERKWNSGFFSMGSAFVAAARP